MNEFNVVRLSTDLSILLRRNNFFFYSKHVIKNVKMNKGKYQHHLGGICFKIHKAKISPKNLINIRLAMCYLTNK